MSAMPDANAIAPEDPQEGVPPSQLQEKEPIPTFSDWSSEQPKSDDPLDVYRGYSNAIKVKLLARGEYTEELANAVDSELISHAQTEGIDMGENPSSNFFNPSQDPDVDLVHRYAIEVGDPSTADAAARLAAVYKPTIKAAYDDPAEYEKARDSALAEFNTLVSASPGMRNAARMAALRRGDSAITTVQNPDGTERLEISPSMAGVKDDKDLAAYFEAHPEIDRRLIGAVRDKLKTPEGFEKPLFELENAQDFGAAFNAFLGTNPAEAGDFNKQVANASANTFGDRHITEDGVARLAGGLSGTPLGQDFSEEAQKGFIRDAIIRAASPATDEKSLDNNFTRLSTGEYNVPMGLMLNKPLFEKAVSESKVIPEAQKKLLMDTRESRVSAAAPETFKAIAAERPEFTSFYDKEKEAGESNAAILDKWMSDPANHSKAADYAKGIAMSWVSGIAGLALYPFALAGSESATAALAGLRKEDMNRRRYAEIFGKNLGFGYDAATMVAPMAVDIAATWMTGGAASAAVAGKWAAKTAFMETMRASLSPLTKSWMKKFTLRSAARGVVRAGAAEGRPIPLKLAKAAVEFEAAAGNVDGVLKLAGADMSRRFATTATNAALFATSFNRSAGQMYVQLHSSLSEQKKPDGSPKYTPEQVREIALGHALVAGTVTGALTTGFQFLGKGGAEAILSRGLSNKQLASLFTRIKSDGPLRDFLTRNGADFGGPDKFFASVIKRSVTPLWKELRNDALHEGYEEGPDQMVQYALQSHAEGSEFRFDEMVRQGAYAAMLGTVMGGAIPGAKALMPQADATPEQEAAVRRSMLFTAATKLDAANLPKTAAVYRNAAINGIPQPASQPTTAATPVQGAVDVGQPAAAAAAAPGGGEVLGADGAAATGQPAPPAAEAVPQGAAEAGLEQAPSGAEVAPVAGEAAPEVAPLAPTPEATTQDSGGTLTLPTLKGSITGEPLATADPEAVQQMRDEEAAAAQSNQQTNEQGQAKRGRKSGRNTAADVPRDDTAELPPARGGTGEAIPEGAGSEQQSRGTGGSGEPVVGRGGESAVESGGRDAGLAEAKSLTEDERADQIEMVQDMIDLAKSRGQEVKQSLINKLAELKGQVPSVAQGDILSNVIEGHPQHEVRHHELEYLIPIKVTSETDLTDRFTRAQKELDRVNTLIGTAEYAVAKAKTPQAKKKASEALGKLYREKDIRDTLRDDIIPELNRLQKEINKAAAPAPEEPILSDTQLARALEPDPAADVADNIRKSKAPEAAIIEDPAAMPAVEDVLGRVGIITEGPMGRMDAGTMAAMLNEMGEVPKVEPSEALVPQSESSIIAGKWNPNSVVFAAVSYPDYNPMGIVQVEHDGTPEGMVAAAKEAERLANEQLGDVSHSGSFAGATDAAGKVTHVVTPGGEANALGTARGDYFAGNLNAFKDDALKRILAAKERGDVAEADRIAQEQIDELEGKNATSKAHNEQTAKELATATAAFKKGGKAEQFDSRFTGDNKGYLSHLRTHIKHISGYIAERDTEIAKWKSLMTKQATPTTPTTESAPTGSNQELPTPGTPSPGTRVSFSHPSVGGEATGVVLDEPAPAGKIKVQVDGKKVKLNVAADSPVVGETPTPQPPKGKSPKPKRLPSRNPAIDKSVVTAELNAHNFQQGTAAFLQSVAATGPKHLRPVAKLLLEFPELLTATPVTLVHLPNAQFAGALIPSTGQVLVNTAIMGPRGSIDTLLHELLHAATVQSIKNPTPAQAKVLARLERVRQSVIKRAKGDPSMDYATSSLDEFVTHFFTSPQFQQQVAAMTPKGQKNWVQVILDTIRELLGAKRKSASDIALEGVMNDMILFTRDAAARYGRPQSQGGMRPVADTRFAVTVDGQVLTDQTTLMLPAHHGTPHKVDKFSTDKIGTGEGAQAYGWGLYFTEDPNVAKQYTVAGLDIGASLAAHARAIESNFGDKAAEWTWQKVKDQQAEYDRLKADKTWSVADGTREQHLRERFDGVNRWVRLAKLLETPEARRPQEGNLYNVEIIPDVSEFLDWDAPLKDQSEKVQRVAAEFGITNPEQKGIWIYKEIAAEHARNGEEGASKMLNERGVLGIKYFAELGKTKGKGANNYVIFNDANLRITHENGKPVTPEVAVAPDPGPYGTPRAEQLLMLPGTPAPDGGASIRDTVRFHELTAGIEETPEGLERFKTEQPEKYAELERMRAEVLRGQGYTVGPVYHGTDTQFSEFTNPTKAEDARSGVGGYYFTDNPEVAASYGGSTLVVYLKKPKTLRNQPYATFGKELVVTDPNQIKSASPLALDPATGKLIQPNQWGDAASNDIRFLPGTEASKVSDLAPDGVLYRSEKTAYDRPGEGAYFYTGDKTYTDNYHNEDRVMSVVSIPKDVVDIRDTKDRKTIAKWSLVELQRMSGSEDFKVSRTALYGLRMLDRAKNAESDAAAIKYVSAAMANVSLALADEAGSGITPGLAEKKFLTDINRTAMTVMESAKEPTGIPADFSIAFKDNPAVGAKLLPAATEASFSTEQSIRDLVTGYVPDGVNPDDLNLDYAQLVQYTEGHHPANAEDIVRSFVNKAISHKAGLDALAEAGEPADEQEAQRLSDLLDRVTRGNTSQSDIDFHRADPSALARLTRYLAAAIKAAWARLTLRWDIRSAVMIDRMNRLLGAAGVNFEERTMQFDPSNPQATAGMLALPGNGMSESDARYMQAVESGDMETAQRMVDEAAKEAGLTKAYHGSTKQGITTFEQSSEGSLGPAIYAVVGEGSLEASKAFASRANHKSGGKSEEVVYPLYVNLGSVLDLDNLAQTDIQKLRVAVPRKAESLLDFGFPEDLIQENSYERNTDPDGEGVLDRDLRKIHEDLDVGRLQTQRLTAIFGQEFTDEFREFMGDAGFDSIKKQSKMRTPKGAISYTEIAFVDPSRIKSADPVTRDAQGKVIPLSQRFNPASSDIRFLPGTTPAGTVPATPPTPAATAPRYMGHHNVYHPDAEMFSGVKDKDFKRPKGFFRRLWWSVSRTDDNPDAVSNIAKASNRVRRADQRWIESHKALGNKLLKKADSDLLTLVQSAVGSNKPMLTNKEARDIANARSVRIADAKKPLQERLDDADRIYNNKLKQATTTLNRAHDDVDTSLPAPERDKLRAAAKAAFDDTKSALSLVRDTAKTEARNAYNEAVREAQDEERAAINRAKVEFARKAREEQGKALMELEASHPAIAEWARESRAAIDELQEMLRNESGMPEHLQFVIDISKGIYLVRMFKAHQVQGYSEAVRLNPEYTTTMENLKRCFTEALMEREMELLRGVDEFSAIDPMSDEVTPELEAAAKEARVEREYKRIKNRAEFKGIPETDLLVIASENVDAQAQILAEEFMIGHETAKKSGVGMSEVRVEFERYMQKKDLPQEMLDALGEITDPVLNLGRTHLALSGLLTTHRELAAFKKAGIESGRIVTKEEMESSDKYRGWKPLLGANPHSPAYAPLSGYYAAPDDKDAFDARFMSHKANPENTAEQQLKGLERVVYGMAGTSLGVVTLGNPAKYMRDMLGAHIMALAQGAFVPSFSGIRATFEAAFGFDLDTWVTGGKVTPEQAEKQTAFVQKAIASGLLNNGVHIGTLKDIMAEMRVNPSNALDAIQSLIAKGSTRAAKLMGKAREGSAVTLDFLGKLSQFTESIANITVFLDKHDALTRAKWSDNPDDIWLEAVRRTQMVMPMKDESSMMTTAWTRSPVGVLLAPFIRFKSEMIRTTINTYRLAYQDIRSGNPVLKAHGIKVLASAATVHGAVTIGLPFLAAAIAGIGDDEDRAIRAALPIYARNSSFWYQRDPKTGGIRTWDMTYLNPYSFVLDPITRSIKAGFNNRWDDIPAVGARFVATEFFGANIMSAAVIDVTRNVDANTDRPIYNDTDTDATKIYKAIAHVYTSAYNPAILKQPYRAIEALQRPVKGDEQFFFTPAGILLNLVVPVKPRDYKVEDIAYRAMRNLSKANSQLWMYTAPMMSPAPISESEFRGAYRDRVAAAMRINQQVWEVAKGLRGLGQRTQQIIKTAENAGFSSEKSAKVIGRGVMDRPVLPESSIIKMGKNNPMHPIWYRDEVSKQQRVIPLSR